MRRLTCAALAVLAMGLTACKQEEEAPKAAPSVAPPPIALKSVVQMNDASAAAQLTRGFSGLEGGTWRWTARTFAAALKPPAGAAQSGAKLHLKFTIPEAVIKQLGPLQLSASVGGTALMPQQYTKGGNYDYVREVGANVLGSDNVTAEFSCDKAIPPTPPERRELAIIALSVGLEPR